MKIAFINIYQNKVYRGAETFVSELSKRLSKNHKVDILTSPWPVVSLKKKYDVVIPTNGRLQAWLVRVIGWLNRSKVVISGQSGAGLDDRINLYTFPDFFVAISDYQLKWAKNVNPFVNAVKIPNGVDLKRFNPVGKLERIVLSVGAFTKEKRHDLTIKAVAKLKDVKLVIAGGGGDLKEDIKTLGKKMLGNRFTILTIPNEKMPEVYKKAGVFAFPTVPWESFGIAMVEAMASGLAVVATDDPIRREIVGDAGIFVDPADTDTYAKVLKEALNKDWRGKPRNQAEKFDWDKIAVEYEKLFKSL